LPNQDALVGLVDSLSSTSSVSRARELFTTLESAYVSDLIADVRVRLRKRNVSGTVTFTELSEGEQQLLMVLGLLRFTKEEESLFLLDEPDTHLNPAWSLRFLELIEEAVGPRESSQLLIASHDPVAISLLRKEQVRQLAFDRDRGAVSAYQPESDPIRLGVAGVLLSELFGFRSVLAPEFVELIDERDRLKSRADALSAADRARLAEIENEVRDIDLSAMHPDPLYARFLSAVFARERAQLDETASLSRDEIREQRALTEDVLAELSAAEGKP
jgi:hypothetical protein